MGRIIDISSPLLLLGLETPTESQRAIVQYCLTAAEGAVKRFLRYDPLQATRTEYYPQMDFSRQGRQEVWEVNDTEAFIRHLSGASTDELQVQHIPIRSITSLKVDYDGRSGSRSGSFGDGTEWTEGTDFWPNYDKVDSSGNKMCSDGIIRSEGRWPAVAGSVQIISIAGFTEDELHGEDTIIDASPIMESIVDETMRRVHKVYSRRKSRAGFAGPFSSESLGDYSYSVDTSILARLVGGSGDLLPETEHKLQDFVNLGAMMAL